MPPRKFHSIVSMGAKESATIKPSATKKTAATSDKWKETVEISDDTSEYDVETLKKTKPGKKAMAEKTQDKERKRRGDSDDDREQSDGSRRGDRPKTRPCSAEGCEQDTEVGSRRYCSECPPRKKPRQMKADKPDSDDGGQNCSEKGYYFFKAAKDGLCNKHPKDNKPHRNGRPWRGSKQVEVAIGQICRHPDCVHWVSKPEGLCSDHHDGSADLPEKPSKPVFEAPKAAPQKAAPKTAGNTKKAHTPAAGREGKCQQQTQGGPLCRNRAAEGSIFCKRHQKSRLDKGKYGDDFGPGSDQDDNDDKPKKKPPTRKIAPLKKTATKSTTTSAPA